ncbi:helix-hairpin-helix domain-containing protein, partial [Veillonella atypica]|uniref:helix-hairpin-helix domain-containing protein n=1 Tax=Veillonella atypica TaxID=39777 RepID=UPI0023B004B6
NLESVLDHIDGIGPKRRKALWAHFNSLEAMNQASIDELAKVDSMNYKTAETLYNFFRISTVEKQEVLQGNKM